MIREKGGRDFAIQPRISPKSEKYLASGGETPNLRVSVFEHHPHSEGYQTIEHNE